MRRLLDSVLLSVGFVFNISHPATYLVDEFWVPFNEIQGLLLVWSKLENNKKITAVSCVGRGRKVRADVQRDSECDISIRQTSSLKDIYNTDF